MRVNFFIRLGTRLNTINAQRRNSNEIIEAISMQVYTSNHSDSDGSLAQNAQAAKNG